MVLKILYRVTVAKIPPHPKIFLERASSFSSECLDKSSKMCKNTSRTLILINIRDVHNWYHCGFEGASFRCQHYQAAWRLNLVKESFIIDINTSSDEAYSPFRVKPQVLPAPVFATHWYPRKPMPISSVRRRLSVTERVSSNEDKVEERQIFVPPSFLKRILLTNYENWFPSITL